MKLRGSNIHYLTLISCHIDINHFLICSCLLGCISLYVSWFITLPQARQRAHDVELGVKEREVR
jgi:uncharacterized membrane protein